MSCPTILQIKKNILELHTHTTNRVQNNKFAGLSREARDYRLSVSRAYTFPNHWESRENMAELEEILQNLLVPDNTVIQQVNDKSYCTSITCFNISAKEHSCDLDALYAHRLPLNSARRSRTLLLSQLL